VKLIGPKPRPNTGVGRVVLVVARERQTTGEKLREGKRKSGAARGPGNYQLIEVTEPKEKGHG